MNTHDIENLSADELKARRDELIDAARMLPPGEVAARYVQARTDAARRDEKLAEQGKTITALQAGMDAAKAQVEASRVEVEQANNAVAATRLDLDAASKALTDAKAAMQRQAARGERLKAVATTHHTAVSAAAKLLNDALAAEAVDNADAGG